MYIKLYSDISLNYGNHVHFIGTEAALQDKINANLLETITDTAAMNYIPNTNTFEIKLTDTTEYDNVSYIIWQNDHNIIRHFIVESVKVYGSYAVYECKRDLWADASTKEGFVNNTLVHVNRSNLMYANYTGWHDLINYTKGNYTETVLGITTGVNAMYVACDIQVDTWSIGSIIYGTTWRSVIILLPSNLAVTSFSDLAQIVSSIVSDSDGNKIKVKNVYYLPFRSSHIFKNIDIVYKTASGTNTIQCQEVKPFTDTVSFTLSSINYDYGNNKVYVGAGNELMEALETYPMPNITYRYIITNNDITVYVEQGDNTKDITEAFTLKTTTNDATLSIQESISKILGSGFKGISGALMLTNPATIMAGTATIAHAGIDLVNNNKASSYTSNGDAVTTYHDNLQYTQIYNIRKFRALGQIDDYTMLYGLNYNFYTDLEDALRGTLIKESISKTYRPYIKGEIIKAIDMTKITYDYVNAELSRGIFIELIEEANE